jgi:hypothetical protein
MVFLKSAKSQLFTPEERNAGSVRSVAASHYVRLGTTTERSRVVGNRIVERQWETLLEDGDAVNAPAAHNLIPALSSFAVTWTPCRIAFPGRH